MDRAKVVKGEIVENNQHFLAVYMEMTNSCLILLSEREDKLGTLAVAVPKPKDLLGPPTSSILVGDRYSISARMFAEHVAAMKGKIALVSIYLEKMDEVQAQSAFKMLIDRVTGTEPQKEGVTA
ncbi:hypothetical protein MUP79_04310 [Candidatus Bathyarchaeota archaeon]|jgi:hypothetical protein|nr:hypothetical protein [Candidatus Bathyarchaeota archaeon]